MKRARQWLHRHRHTLVAWVALTLIAGAATGVTQPPVWVKALTALAIGTLTTIGLNLDDRSLRR